MNESDFKMNVIGWAQKRKLIRLDNSVNQLLKLGEETGELMGAHLKSDRDGVIDSIGDIDVVIEIYCEQMGIDRKKCRQQAWDEIKNRKGKTVNGTFIKES